MPCIDYIVPLLLWFYYFRWTAAHSGSSISNTILLSKWGCAGPNVNSWPQFLNAFLNLGRGSVDQRVQTGEMVPSWIYATLHTLRCYFRPLHPRGFQLLPTIFGHNLSGKAWWRIDHLTWRNMTVLNDNSSTQLLKGCLNLGRGSAQQMPQTGEMVPSWIYTTLNTFRCYSCPLHPRGFQLLPTIFGHNLSGIIHRTVLNMFLLCGPDVTPVGCLPKRAYLTFSVPCIE